MLNNNYQLASDLHLEFFTKIPKNVTEEEFFSNIITPLGKYLLLAGDIGNPKSIIYDKFIQWTSTKFRKVFLITGNHEYYGKTISEVDRYLKEKYRQGNVIFLQRRGYRNEDGIIILGCTLWSDVNNFMVELLMNDYKRIKLKQRPFRINMIDIINLHLKHQLWLEHQLEKHSGPIIVISHHLPSYDLIDEKYLDDQCNSGYASNLNDLLAKYKDKIIAWVYGHSHSSLAMSIEGVGCYRNPRGYPKTEDYNKSYQNNYIL